MRMIVLAAVLGAGLACFSGVAAAQEVRVTLTGVEARGGQILATLQTESEFMQARGAYGVALPAPQANGDVVVVFENVAPGAYAFSALHDVNGDFQMQREANGRPLEGWAMHNGASLRARPTFAQVQVEIGAGGANLAEPMIYPAQ